MSIKSNRIGNMNLLEKDKLQQKVKNKSINELLEQKNIIQSKLSELDEQIKLVIN